MTGRTVSFGSDSSIQPEYVQLSQGEAIPMRMRSNDSEVMSRTLDEATESSSLSMFVEVDTK